MRNAVRLGENGDSPCLRELRRIATTFSGTPKPGHARSHQAACLSADVDKSCLQNGKVLSPENRRLPHKQRRECRCSAEFVENVFWSIVAPIGYLVGVKSVPVAKLVENVKICRRPKTEHRVAGGFQELVQALQELRESRVAAVEQSLLKLVSIAIAGLLLLLGVIPVNDVE